ncbi:hypothetical protein MKW92_038253 [Papaver armeniacum]|nr:hypothetical protein MKW92_038253 [Papaver armeniacum]
MDGRGCFAKSCSDGTSARLPVAHMMCRQSPPVETVFHEFGHALQHTKEDEGLVFSIRGIEWDAVEFPSQFMENRCYQRRDTLMSLAKHYETGETLPEEVYLKLLAARTFRAGTQSLRQIKFSSTDLELQVSYIPGGSESIFDIDRRWAEVLSADAFSAVEDAGLDNEKAVKETGRKFRETVLAVGSGKPPLEVFVQFRGGEPSQAQWLVSSSYGVCLNWHLPSISLFSSYIRTILKSWGCVRNPFIYNHFPTTISFSYIVFYFLGFSLLWCI